jgi:dTDP-4-amino-4,6-dideoxygalactose transaminase
LSAVASNLRIYLSPPHVGATERELLLSAFDSNWISTVGPHVDAFEREMAAACGVGHAAGLSSGTAALHLALLLLGVGRGDEVLCSDLTFAASANAITYVGAVPVFIDSDPASWNMDPGLLEEELAACARRGKLPRAVMVVDLYGQCADYDRIAAICARHGVPLIEDAAEALGATYRGKPAGKFGVMSVLSFNGNKIMTTSGGGMLLSDQEEHIALAKKLATQAREPVAHYEHTMIGYNYRLSNLLAAVGRGQLQSLQDRVARRRATFDEYKRALGGEAGVEFMPEIEGGRSTRWLTCLTVDPAKFGASREDIRLHLESMNIESRAVWKPMHLQPVYKDHRIVGGAVSKRLFEDGLCLPSGSNLSDADRARIIAGVLSTPHHS